MMRVPVAGELKIRIELSLELEEPLELRIGQLDLLARGGALIREIKAAAQLQGRIVERAKRTHGPLHACGRMNRAEIKDHARVIALRPAEERAVISPDRADRAVDVFDAGRSQR